MILLKNTSGFLAYVAGVLVLLVTIAVLACYEVWEKIPYFRFLKNYESDRKLSRTKEADILHQV